MENKKTWYVISHISHNPELARFEVHVAIVLGPSPITLFFFSDMIAASSSDSDDSPKVVFCY